ncbi:MAG: TolC family protein [Lentisphaeria bacterium]|nr:TolC family protein [Lentisphaeria bacterium]
MSRPLFLFVLSLVAAPFFLCADDAAAPEPMGLGKCIAHAMKHSQTLHMAAIDLDTKQLQTIIQRAVFDFEFNYTGKADVDAQSVGHDASLKKRIVGGFDATVSTGLEDDREGTGDASYVTLKLSKKLLGTDSTFFSTRKSIEDSLTEELKTLNELHRQRREVAYRVTAAFYQVIRNLQSKTVVERSLARARRNLENAIEREKPLDISTARIQVPDNELSLLKAERSIANGLDTLKVIMGMPVAQSLNILSEFQFTIAKTDIRIDTGFAMDNFETLINNRLDDRKLRGDVRIAKQELWPDLNASVTQGWDTASDSHNFRGGDDSLLFSLGLSWKLGRRKDRAEWRKKINSLRRNSRNWSLLSERKRQKLFDLSRQLDERARNIDLQRRKIALVTRQVELYVDRYENGEIDILEFIRSQNDLENAKVESIKLETSYMELLASYYYEVGRWPVPGVSEPDDNAPPPQGPPVD